MSCVALLWLPMPSLSYLLHRMSLKSVLECYIYASHQLQETFCNRSHEYHDIYTLPAILHIHDIFFTTLYVLLYESTTSFESRGGIIFVSCHMESSDMNDSVFECYSQPILNINAECIAQVAFFTPLGRLRLPKSANMCSTKCHIYPFPTN